MLLDRGDQILGFPESIFRVTRDVPQPIYVEIVPISGDLISGKAAESSLLALIRT